MRGYIQSDADFYNSNYFKDEIYISSDSRLSDFNALTYKASINYKIHDDVEVNFGANYYNQSTDLSATYFVTGVRYSF